MRQVWNPVSVKDWTILWPLFFKVSKIGFFSRFFCREDYRKLIKLRKLIYESLELYLYFTAEVETFVKQAEKYWVLHNNFVEIRSEKTVIDFSNVSVWRSFSSLSLRWPTLMNFWKDSFVEKVVNWQLSCRREFGIAEESWNWMSRLVYPMSIHSWQLTSLKIPTEQKCRRLISVEPLTQKIELVNLIYRDWEAWSVFLVGVYSIFGLPVFGCKWIRWRFVHWELLLK